MKRTGLIVAMSVHATQAEAAHIREQLEERFPGVTVALVAGASDSVAFEWDDDR